MTMDTTTVSVQAQRRAARKLAIMHKKQYFRERDSLCPDPRVLLEHAQEIADAYETLNTLCGGVDFKNQLITWCEHVALHQNTLTRPSRERVR